jgi:regulator of protease activity HflC (stomatin/prohibitin superfamily)
MKRLLITLGGVLVALWILLPQVFFILDEREQAIITQFGAYVRTVAQPGLHARMPLVHTVHRFDRRVLATDATPAEYLTLDKKRVVVDYVARWRIADPLAFFMSVRALEGARAPGQHVYQPAWRHHRRERGVATADPLGADDQIGDHTPVVESPAPAGTPEPEKSQQLRPSAIM